MFDHRHCIHWHIDSCNLHMCLYRRHSGDSCDHLFHIHPGLNIKKNELNERIPNIDMTH